MEMEMKAKDEPRHNRHTGERARTIRYTYDCSLDCQRTLPCHATNTVPGWVGDVHVVLEHGPGAWLHSVLHVVRDEAH